jgi:hypothetical protein
LNSAATFAEYETWESYMVHGFAWYRTLDSIFGGHIEYVIAYRRVDTKVASWWCDDRSAKGITSKTSSWEDFKHFLRTRFVKKSVDSDKVVVQEVPAEVMEEAKPLHGLNMQFKWVYNYACTTVEWDHRWSLFQTQCMIKGTTCKLMVDGGSCTNGISKAMVASFGFIDMVYFWT